MSDDAARLLELAEKVAAGDSIDFEIDATAGSEIRVVRNLQKIAGLSSHFSSIPAPNDPQTDNASENEPPRSFEFSWGHLQVMERIGEGGFGEVYRAYDPILCREVALKLRRSEPIGIDAEARLFIDEARRIARVRHRNVLAVHGADVREGRAGLWADLLSGRTLEAELKEEGFFNTTKTLSIALAMASALGAIRNAGLIHGDVKASNVMLEDSGTAVLMDFGAGGELSDRNSVAKFASPLSAAPELFDGDTPNTASDQYSLGVLLYRMLYGEYPTGAQSLDELVQWHDRRRDGRRSMLRKPEGPLEKLAAALLHPNPAERLTTSGVLAELRRIQELPARRKKRIAVAAVILSMAIGTIAASIGFLQARDSEAIASTTSSELSAVNEFLQDVLASPRPTGSGRQTTVTELMEIASRRVDIDLAAHPAARARTYAIIGLTYVHMYEWEKAEAALRESLALREDVSGYTDLETLYTRANYAAALLGLGREDDAETVLEPVFANLQDVPIGHPVQTQSRLTRAHIAWDREEFDSAQALFEELLGLRNDDAWQNDQIYRATQNEYAKLLEERGEYKQAMTHAEDLLAWSLERRGEESQTTLNALQLQAIIYARQGDTAKSLELMTRTRDVTRAWLGDDDRMTYIAMMNVASATLAIGRYAEGLELLDDVLERKDDFYPPTHYNSLSIESNYAIGLSLLGKDEQAIPVFRDLAPRVDASLGQKHHLALMTKMYWAGSISKTGNPAAGLRMGLDTRATMADVMGDQHPMTLNMDSIIGSIHINAGDNDAAAQLLQATVRSQREVIGELNADTLTTELYLAQALRDQDHGEIGAMLDQLLEKSTGSLGREHPLVVSVEAEIARLEN